MKRHVPQNSCKSPLHLLLSRTRTKKLSSLRSPAALSIHNATANMAETYKAMQQLPALKSDDDSVLGKKSHLCYNMHTLSGRAVGRGRAVSQDPPLRLALDDSQQLGVLLGGPVD